MNPAKNLQIVANERAKQDFFIAYALLVGMPGAKQGDGEMSNDRLTFSGRWHAPRTARENAYVGAPPSACRPVGSEPAQNRWP